MTNHTLRRSRQQFEIEELLAALPEDAAFPSTSGQAFISIPVGVGVQTFPLASAYVSDWLTDQYRKRHGQLPNENSVRGAIKSLRTQVHCRPRPRPVDVRIVKSATAIFIDLANPEGEAVQITPTNWQITRPFEVAFRSTRGQLPLPKPELLDSQTPGLLDSLPLRNWLLAALQPTGPYPVLVLHGPPGSGKTTAARMLRALIDPVTAPIQPLPSRGREVLKLAVRDRVLAFDHVTRMSNSTADAICQISSGTAVGEKEPGDRNREPFRLDIARPVILTTPRCGVSDWQPRADLADRIIAVEMPRIENPRPAQDLWAEFEAARPAILATLYTALSNTLTTPHDTRATSHELRAPSLYESSAQADPLYKAIWTFMDQRGQWTGTAADLNLPVPNPLTPRALSHRLRQLQPTLATHGIEIEFRRKHNGIREIAIRCTPHENLRHPSATGLLTCVPGPCVPDSQTPGLPPPPPNSSLESTEIHPLEEIPA